MALTNLKEIYKDKGRSFVESLFTKYVIVSEQIDGSRITINRDLNNRLCYCKKDGSPINFIDRTMMVFYETAFAHFEAFSMETLLKMPENWIFGFQYFPSNAPANITYDRTPENGLILTDIQIVNQDGRTVKTISDPRVLADWSNILQVEKPPVIFNGYLTGLQKEKILEYLSTPEKDLDNIFNSQSFTRYIISILNPDLRTSALMNDIDKPIEGIVFKFITPGENEVYSARLIDPIFQAHASSVQQPIQRRSNDIYQIAMLDIIEYVEMLKLDDISLQAETPDERYIELICQIFNDYIKENGHKYIGVDFETPDFAKKPEFEINMSSIPNERTKEILRNQKLNDLFKIMVSSFRKYRKNVTPILTQNIVDVLNKKISEIQKKIEMIPEENEVLDFNNYLKRNQIEGMASIFEKLTSDETEDEYSVMSYDKFMITESQAINEAQEKYPISLVTLLKSAGKLEMFYQYVDSLPKGKARVEFKQFFERLANDKTGKSYFPIMVQQFKSLRKMESILKIDLTQSYYKEMWPIKPEGTGPGEILITWLVKDAVTQGGGESFDIKYKDEKWEVKSLISAKDGKIGPTPNSIDGAKYSDTTNYALTSELQSFYRDVLDVYYDNDLRGSVLSLTDNESEKKSITEILDALESIPRTTADGSKNLSQQMTELVSSIFDKFYNGIVKINKNLKKVQNLQGSSRIAVKSKTTNSQYWLEPEAVDKITTAAGSDNDINIKVGTEITDENKDAKIWFSKLISNSFVKNPKTFTKQLKNMLDGFLEGKDGLIYLTPPGKFEIAYDMSDFHVSSITRGKYRFMLDGFRKGGDYEYAKGQK
jgi:hypothetical protein